MLKAAAGGGGKGIRKISNEAELKKMFLLPLSMKLRCHLVMMQYTWKKI